MIRVPKVKQSAEYKQIHCDVNQWVLFYEIDLGKEMFLEELLIKPRNDHNLGILLDDKHIIYDGYLKDLYKLVDLEGGKDSYQLDLIKLYKKGALYNVVFDIQEYGQNIKIYQNRRDHPKCGKIKMEGYLLTYREEVK